MSYALALSPFPLIFPVCKIFINNGVLMRFSSVIFIILISLGAASCQENKVKKEDLKTQQDKVSYSIGLDIGKNLKQNKIEVEMDKFVQGLKDGMKDTTQLMTQEEIASCMQQFQQDMMQKKNDDMKVEGDKNKKAGEEFLKVNKTTTGVKTTASGLQYKVLKSGTGKTPKAADTVVAHYKGTLIDGTEFDNSYKRGEPLTIPVSGVIKGWTEALLMMKEGDKWMLYIPSELGYGEYGAGNVIGPNAALIFEIELISVK